MSYKDYIKEVKDFPIEGVNFKDISPLFADQETFRSALVDMGGYFDDKLTQQRCIWGWPTCLKYGK